MLRGKIVLAEITDMPDNIIRLKFNAVTDSSTPTEYSLFRRPTSPNSKLEFYLDKTVGANPYKLGQEYVIDFFHQDAAPPLHEIAHPPVAPPTEPPPEPQPTSTTKAGQVKGRHG